MTTVNDFEEEKTVKIPLFGIPTQKLPTYRRKPDVGTMPIASNGELNRELLTSILSFVKEHPTTWLQSDWFKVVDRRTGEETYMSETNEYEEQNSCGTSFCFAGHVALAEGFPPPPTVNGSLWDRKVDGSFYNETVDEFAYRRLGISSTQAEELFDGSNSLVDLERMVILLIASNGEVDWYDLEHVRLLDEEDHEGFEKLLSKVLFEQI